jgi:hypothetical protein
MERGGGAQGWVGGSDGEREREVKRRREGGREGRRGRKRDRGRKREREGYIYIYI